MSGKPEIAIEGRLPRVLLCTCGTAQAEVVPRLVHNLNHHPDIGRHEVIVAATPSFLNFYEKSVVEKLITRKVFVDDHNDGTEEFPVPHINLAEWADVVLVYPASANTIGKCAHGICDTLVSGIVLAATCPVYFGPTMNKAMSEKSIYLRNVETLRLAGYRFIPQTLTKVVVKATGLWEEKLFCSEVMVLNVCDELFWSNPQEEDETP